MLKRCFFIVSQVRFVYERANRAVWRGQPSAGAACVGTTNTNPVLYIAGRHSPQYPQTLLHICSGRSWCICQNPPKKRLWWSGWRTVPGPETPHTGTRKVRRVRALHHGLTFNTPPYLLFTPPFDAIQDPLFFLVALISAGLTELKWLPMHSAGVWSLLIKTNTLLTSFKHLYLYSVSGATGQTQF